VTDRKYERVPARLEVEFRNAGAFLVAYSTNLSRGGMFVESGDGEPLPVGHQIALRFAVPGEPTIEVVGVVAWVQAWSTSEHERGMGIRFEQLDDRHGELIDRLVGGFRGLRVVVMSADDSMMGQLARAVRSVIGSALVVETPNVEEAERALEEPTDLVLLDLALGLEDALDGDASNSLPGSSHGSAEALLCLRLAKAHQPPVPVLAIAHTEERRRLARELGADTVLSNPPSSAELSTEVLRLLGKPSGTALS
jgi:uncharacterized protein (TIGR02266 family)